MFATFLSACITNESERVIGDQVLQVLPGEFSQHDLGQHDVKFVDGTTRAFISLPRA
jgi:hypothetical protein